MNKSGCTCIDFRTVTNRLTRLYDDAMAPSGMTVTQFSLLNAIRELQAPTLNQLSQAKDLDRTTLGRNVRVLEKLGFISVQAGEDARTRVMQLTPHGWQAFKRAAPLWQNIQDGLIESLGTEQHARLTELLTDTEKACAALAAQ